MEVLIMSLFGLVLMCDKILKVSNLCEWGENISPIYTGETMDHFFS